MKRFLTFLIASVVVLVALVSPVSAFQDRQARMGNNIVFWDPDFDKCSEGGGGSSSGGSKLKDYTKSRDIIRKAQMDTIKQHQDIYEAVEKDTGVPWEMLAVIHLRETGLGKENPTNGQGIYQNSTGTLDEYPAGPVTDEDGDFDGDGVNEPGFISQTTWAANFLKGKATTESKLLAGDKEAVKDTFFGYNGRAAAYATQATALGFDKAYEGSPYVMNKADAKRDPATNATGWGQIKQDGGPIEYPANADYGAYVVYAALAGIGEECEEGGDLQSKIVEIAEQEYGLWQSGSMGPRAEAAFQGDDSKNLRKYTYGRDFEWCAMFASWVLKEAGAPVNTKDPPWWSYAYEFHTLGVSQKGYTAHANDGSYQAKPGDLALYADGDGYYHVNIIIANEGGSLVSIGGNEGAGENGTYLNSKVKKNTGYANSAATFMTVKK